LPLSLLSQLSLRSGFGSFRCERFPYRRLHHFAGEPEWIGGVLLRSFLLSHELIMPDPLNTVTQYFRQTLPVPSVANGCKRLGKRRPFQVNIENKIF
jgi:hypothetical protein